MFVPFLGKGAWACIARIKRALTLSGGLDLFARLGVTARESESMTRGGVQFILQQDVVDRRREVGLVLSTAVLALCLFSFVQKFCSHESGVLN